MPSNDTIRLVQMEVRPGSPRENLRRMLAALDEARRAGVGSVAFPELAIPGYLLGDEWERPSFLRECEQCGEELRLASQGLTVFFGNVGLEWQRHNEDGRVRKYNALFVAEEGRFIAPEGSDLPFVVKTLMPNYREFDDSRHFYDTRKLAQERGVPVAALIRPVLTRCGRVGALLCEDAWDQDYPVSPLSILGGHGATWFLNLSCSPFTVNKNSKRHRVFSAAARKLGRPILYVNNVGLQDNGKTVFTFDGSSCAYDAAGAVVARAAPFREMTLDCPLAAHPAGGEGEAFPADGVAMITAALQYGTRQFMERCGVQRVVVGASGGIDSAVVAALHARVVPVENLILVNMPSRFNSRTTISLARELATRLGCGYAEVSIEESVALTRTQLDGLGVQWPGLKRPLALDDFSLENVQARDRSARLLAGVAAACGGVFTCNANKAEMTVGYTTLYGDLGGYLATIADLWKGEVYAVGRYLNESVYGREVIPEGVFSVTPSAELSVAQAVDEGKGDPLIYPYHDRLFRSWVEEWNRTTPEEILQWFLEGTLEQRLGYEGKVSELFKTPADFVADLERWWRQYQGMGVAKRIQAPPVLAVKRRAFGFDHREAQLGARYTARYAQLKTQVRDQSCWPTPA